MKTIIVPTDFTEIAEKAYPVAASLGQNTGCRIVFLHNVTTLLLWDVLSQEEKQKYPQVNIETREAESKLNQLLDRDEFKNLHCELLITHGVAYEQVIIAARKLKADLIVMGSHRNIPGGKSFIDSTIQKVMHRSTCPVMSINNKTDHVRWDTALVPLSFNEDIHDAFRSIRDFAVKMGSTIHLLYINRPEKFKETSLIEKQANDFTSHYPELQFKFGVLDSLEMESGILEYVARIKPDYLAMVTHDHRTRPKYLIGTTETVAYHADIPLMSVPMLRNVTREELSSVS